MFKSSNSEKNKKKGKKSQTSKDENDFWHTTYINIWSNVKSKLDVSNYNPIE